MWFGGRQIRILPRPWLLEMLRELLILLDLLRDAFEL